MQDGSWPHYKKDDENARLLGIYRENGGVVKEKLLNAEKQHIDELMRLIEEGDHENLQDYTNAIIDFLIGCGIRWYRHWIDVKNHEYFSDFSKPSMALAFYYDF